MCTQIAFTAIDLRGLRGVQPGQDVLNRFGVLGQTLQFALRVEHRWPPSVRRRGGIAARTVKLDSSSAGEKPFSSAFSDLLTSPGVLRQRGSDVYAQTVEKRALSGHAATNDAGQIWTELEPDWRLAVLRIKE